MVLGEVEETVTSVEIDEETYEEVYKVNFFCYFNFLLDLNLAPIKIILT